MNQCPPPSVVAAHEPWPIYADYLVELAGHPVSFVARLPAIQQVWGPEFSQSARDAAWLRAASTLAHMGLVRGLSFQFFRLGVKWSVADAAAYFQVPTATVDAWEAETEALPLHVYTAMASYVDLQDGRQSYPMGVVCPSPPTYRVRQIRIYPDVPQQPQVLPPTGDPCPPCPC